MKTMIITLAAVAALLLTGCSSTITHYDDKGNITRVEEVTNFSRVMDGTNEKSQLVLMEGTFIGFEASATAGENCTPGVVTQFVNGKAAMINVKKGAGFTGADDVVKEFFTGEIAAGPEGIKKK